MTNDNNDDDCDSLALLEKAQAMVQVEQALTATLEKVEPWLLSATTTDIDPHRPRVRPIPQTMAQVQSILSVARNLASRTSAPACWNPAAPVVGFSTPNPLPHQLRGGALAALQLDRAKQAERDRKRQRVAAEEQTTKKSSSTKSTSASATKEAQPAAHGKGDPAILRDQSHRRAPREKGEPSSRRSLPKQQEISMDLSGSSSSEDSDSD